MLLTRAQMSHFETFGYLIFPELLCTDEVARYSAEFDLAIAADLVSGSHDLNHRRLAFAETMGEDTPFMASLADDPRFADVAEQLVGRHVLHITCDARLFKGDVDWHTDIDSSETEAYRGVKFAIYLEPLRGHTGALRCIPGSHAARIEQLPPMVLDVNPGDVVVFELALLHASTGGAPGRRQGTVVYYEDPITPEATGAVVRQCRANEAAMVARAGLPPQPKYPQYWRDWPRYGDKRDKRHARWVRRMAELGVLPPLLGNKL
eukprot:COSAG05_NODE_272_length_12454_cov_1460.218085_1_plen_263_part_00